MKKILHPQGLVSASISALVLALVDILIKDILHDEQV